MARELQQQALNIWRAGVEAVAADRLVERCLRLDGATIAVTSRPNAEPLRVELKNYDRLIVVGAGKASAAMAIGLMRKLSDIASLGVTVDGWINVPADCVRQIDGLTVHAARPAGINEPTAEAVAGTERMIELLSTAGPRDLAVCLLSGGGSALLAAPIAGVSLESKVQLIRFLSESGANIREINTVRKQLSRVKGNRLAEVFTGSQLFSLIISDVIGDPLDVVASGPTVPSDTSASDAVEVLQQFDPDRKNVSAEIHAALEAAVGKPTTGKRVADNILIGNLESAVMAAGDFARQAGLNVETSVARQLEGTAEEIGFRLADELYDRLAQTVASDDSARCLVSGGEPVVQLVNSAIRGKGGRNQQLVLAALVRLMERGFDNLTHRKFCVLSGGTDGEDGPTDAAGAMICRDTLEKVRSRQVDPVDFLRRNDAHAFFEQVGGLIKTGPTHTNVGDLRIVIG